MILIKRLFLNPNMSIIIALVIYGWSLLRIILYPLTVHIGLMYLLGWYFDLYQQRPMSFYLDRYRQVKSVEELMKINCQLLYKSCHCHELSTLTIFFFVYIMSGANCFFLVILVKKWVGGHDNVGNLMRDLECSGLLHLILPHGAGDESDDESEDDDSNR